MNTSTNTILLNACFPALQRFLLSLALPYTTTSSAKGHNLQYTPYILTTILLRTSVKDPAITLMQNQEITWFTVHDLLRSLELTMIDLVSILAQNCREQAERTDLVAANKLRHPTGQNLHFREGSSERSHTRRRRKSNLFSQKRRTQGSERKSQDKANAVKDKTSHRLDLTTLLDTGLFALSRMPQEAAPVLVLLTDGVLKLPTSSLLYNNTINRLLRSGIACHILQTTSSTVMLQSPFGFLPASDSLQYLASITGGSFFDQDWMLRLQAHTISPPCLSSTGASSSGLFITPPNNSHDAFLKRRVPNLEVVDPNGLLRALLRTLLVRRLKLEEGVPTQVRVAIDHDPQKLLAPQNKITRVIRTRNDELLCLGDSQHQLYRYVWLTLRVLFLFMSFPRLDT